MSFNKTETNQLTNLGLQILENFSLKNKKKFLFLRLSEETPLGVNTVESPRGIKINIETPRGVNNFESPSGVKKIIEGSVPFFGEFSPRTPLTPDRGGEDGIESTSINR